MNKDKIIKIIDKCLLNSPCDADIRYDEPMSAHTSFKVGGPADCLLRPVRKERKNKIEQRANNKYQLDENEADDIAGFCAALLNLARSAGIPVFILGGGANIVVGDRGIRGIVLDTGGLKGQTLTEEGLIINSGTSMDEAAEYAASAGLSGLEFLAGMPGSIGGIVWMNARCYGSEISDVLNWTEILLNEKFTVSNEQTARFEQGNDSKDITEDSKYTVKKIITGQSIGFGYKSSPFQKLDCLILRACFNLSPGGKDAIRRRMEKNRRDRTEKGHYLFPCAGSVFKNNHDFGKPTGLIIDELGMRGLRLGGAQVAPFHGNIIINTGNATAADIRALADKVAANVKAATGFILEPEILFIGE